MNWIKSWKEEDIVFAGMLMIAIFMSAAKKQGNG